MFRGIKVEVLWFDEHVVEFRVRAANGRFAGAADLYDAHDCPIRLAECFRGFPRVGGDQRQIEFGTFDPGHGGGGVRIELRCSDGAGHVVANIELRSDSRDGETAKFPVHLEAAGIDRFAAALDRMGIVAGSAVSLEGAT